MLCVVEGFWPNTRAGDGLPVVIQKHVSMPHPLAAFDAVWNLQNAHDLTLPGFVVWYCAFPADRLVELASWRKEQLRRARHGNSLTVNECIYALGIDPSEWRVIRMLQIRDEPVDQPVWMAR